MSNAITINDIKSNDNTTLLEKTSGSCFNFYDWFCQDRSLRNKANRLFAAVRSFVKRNKLVSTNVEDVCFFRNCMSGAGRTYDCFTLAKPAEGGDVLAYVSPSNHDGYAELAYEGHGLQQGDSGALLFKTYSDLLKYIAKPDDFEMWSAKESGIDESYGHLFAKKPAVQLAA